MIEVVQDAQNIDAYQKNDNLLLSKHARADTIPGLEILADEVRCTHGATAGQIDPEQIYYLMSRGLPQHWAEEVIVSGFLEPVLQRIPSNDLRNRLKQSISHKLEKDATPVSAKQ
jgi:Fe-S cluster assembly protein SufD